jgi:pimeloyl-ACP methyl ester carboxylesterase
MALATCMATAFEKRRPLAVDAIIPDPLFTSTHAITIDAPPTQVWPWIAQMGAGRAGWYSWDAIDNGASPSARSIRPGLQTVVPGDIMPAVPGATDAFVVTTVDPPRALVLTVPDAHGGSAVAWEHLLEPVSGGRTRLLVRGRASSHWLDLARAQPPAGHRRIFIERAYALLARLPRPLLIGFAALGHRLMEARHLRGIQRRSTASSATVVNVDRSSQRLVPLSRASGFKTRKGEAAFRAAYDAVLKLWAVPHEELDIATRFGSTHVIVCGPTNGPPLVLLHGYMATSTMWAPNIADFSKDYRIYAIDVMGQSSKSIPDQPIANVADFVSWLTATLDALHLDRISLVGMSFGGWLALNYAVAVPQRIQKLVLLSPGGLLPMVRQFTVRGMLMVLLPTRITVNAFFHWLGFTDRTYANLLDLVYLGLKHFRTPFETARILPTVVSDEALRTMNVPTLLLIGDHEVISDPAQAMERARRLIRHFEGELVPGCRHDMCASQYEIVDARVLGFLRKTRAGDRTATTERSVA